AITVLTDHMTMLGKKAFVLFRYRVGFHARRPQSPNFIDHQNRAGLKNFLKPIRIFANVIDMKKYRYLAAVSRYRFIVEWNICIQHLPLFKRSNNDILKNTIAFTGTG